MSNETRLAPLADTLPAPLTPNTSAMFERGDIVRHQKSMRLYLIHFGPPMTFDENSGAPVYVYAAAPLIAGGTPDPRIWVRPQHQMEEAGRFVLHKKHRI